VEEQGIKTWSFYRYRLIVEYKDKPTLAPPLIVIGLLWQIITSLCRKRYNKDKICGFS